MVATGSKRQCVDGSFPLSSPPDCQISDCQPCGHSPCTLSTHPNKRQKVGVLTWLLCDLGHIIPALYYPLEKLASQCRALSSVTTEKYLQSDRY